MRVLLSWLGGTDLRAAAESEPTLLGPLASGVMKYVFDRIVILNNYSAKESKHYVPWLKKHTDATIDLKKISDLPSPVDYRGIYTNAISAIDDIKEQYRAGDYDLTLHLSPGTPQMQAIWILIAKTYAPKATLIQSSREEGVSEVNIPFDITADFIDDFFKEPDDRLTRLAQGLPPEAPQFSKIVHKSRVMKRVIAEARLLARRRVPILIEGETGTGKELFARAIHDASPRSEQLFIPINCGAIPAQLLESELFGYTKGTFTGQDAKGKMGHFETANKGTIFLDEIGEMPLDQQVRLLRVLQEGQITRLGASTPKPIDVRVITATNRSIYKEVMEGRFREDLLYRLAVGVIQLPPLRTRKGDIPVLIEHVLNEINTEQEKTEAGYKSKSLSAAAMNSLKQQDWPGNIRELQNTLTRASIWANGNIITAEDVKDSLFQMPRGDSNGDGILHRPIDSGIDLNEIQSEVARHYLKRAMEAAPGNKTRAAKLLGLNSYQTLNNWLETHGVET